MLGFASGLSIRFGVISGEYFWHLMVASAAISVPPLLLAMRPERINPNRSTIKDE
jgi:hypothetical protein